MREQLVVDKVVEHAEATGWLARKTTYAGRHGCADFDFIGHGHILPVEFKRPTAEAKIHQDRERVRFKEVGVKMHLIDDIDKGIALLDQFKAKPRPYGAP